MTLIFIIVQNWCCLFCCSFFLFFCLMNLRLIGRVLISSCKATIISELLTYHTSVKYVLPVSNNGKFRTKFFFFSCKALGFFLSFFFSPRRMNYFFFVYMVVIEYRCSFFIILKQNLNIKVNIK